MKSIIQQKHLCIAVAFGIALVQKPGGLHPCLKKELKDDHPNTDNRQEAPYSPKDVTFDRQNRRKDIEKSPLVTPFFHFGPNSCRFSDASYPRRNQ
jgi:hypothetical protein